MLTSSTYSAKPTDIDMKWFLIDAEGVVLGRMAAIVANILRGKHKPIYTPHIDCGDNVIIINADRIVLTGSKRRDKTYYWHTGYPGGIKSRTAEQILDGKFPDRVITKAVKRMLPKTKLGRKQIGKLRVYASASHPHEAQSPEVLDIASINRKNKGNA
ncbi:MAG: 50S ribosomal protein L13 [Rhodospirillaceae bacterium]|nr:50S ribosomal protein L13 [Rhodospirillaceae bacterium]